MPDGIRAGIQDRILMMPGGGDCLFFQHDDGAGLRDKGA